jgi:hypothetical protein
MTRSTLRRRPRLRKRSARDATPGPSRPSPRELAARVADGIAIALLWHPAQDSVSIAVQDAETGHAVEFPVARERALEAFHHPFAYAP